MKLKLKDYIDCNNCDTNYVINYFKMKALFEAFKVAVAYNNLTEAATIYETLETMCDFENCNCN